MDFQRIYEIMEKTIIKLFNPKLIVRAHINLLILIISIIFRIQFNNMNKGDIKILIINHIIPKEVLINKIMLLIIVVIALKELKVKCMDLTLTLDLQVMEFTKILIKFKK